MCGIVGVIGGQEAAGVLVGALSRLEYRGYDSAGIATLVNGHIERRRAEGKLSNLAAVLEHEPLRGRTGIGHTRWATHGAPTQRNAHPHGTARTPENRKGATEPYGLPKQDASPSQRHERPVDTRSRSWSQQHSRIPDAARHICSGHERSR